jgi:hypothetical protein
MGVALLFYMYMMFVPQGKHAYGPPRPLTGITSLFYMWMIFVPQRKHIWASTDCCGDNFTFLYVDDVRTSKETHMGLHGLLRG